MFSLKRSISKFWRSLHSLQVFWDALPVCTLEVVLVEPANWENYSLRCHRLSRVGSGTTVGPVTNAVHAPTDGDSWSCRHEVYQTNSILMLFLCQNQLNYRIAKEHIDTKNRYAALHRNLLLTRCDTHQSLSSKKTQRMDQNKRRAKPGTA